MSRLKNKKKFFFILLFLPIKKFKPNEHIIYMYELINNIVQSRSVVQNIDCLLDGNPVGQQVLDPHHVRAVCLQKLLVIFLVQWSSFKRQDLMMDLRIPEILADVVDHVEHDQPLGHVVEGLVDDDLHVDVDQLKEVFGLAVQITWCTAQFNYDYLLHLIVIP